MNRINELNVERQYRKRKNEMKEKQIKNEIEHKKRIKEEENQYQRDKPRRKR